MLRHSIVLSILVAACGPGTEPYQPLGSPLFGLSDQELGRFRQGEALFNHVFTPTEGVGPLFNENQCSACHTLPATGGTGEQFLIKATRFTAPDRCDRLNEQGGENVRTQATPPLKAHGIDRQAIPENATERARFTVPFIFGLGLVDAIPEDAITRRADPLDADRDGISGRAGLDARGNFARFGRKAELANVRDFIDTALRFEMGLTTVEHPHEGTMSGRPFPADVDPAADPEIDARTQDLLNDFVQFLAPPHRIRLESEQERLDVARGEELFHAAGCAACHVPAMKTARSESPAFDRKWVYLYSDLLLHDVGPALANVCGIVATPTELRTAMLMGLGRRQIFMHDGRTFSVHDAILRHGGEASPARDRYRRINRLEQEKLLLFLRTL